MTEETLSLRKRILQLLKEEKEDEFDVTAIAVKLNVGIRSVYDAVYALKKAQKIIPLIGIRPSKYVINENPQPTSPEAPVTRFTPDDMSQEEKNKRAKVIAESVKGALSRRAALLVADHNENPLNAREIAEKLGVELDNVRYSLSFLKTRGYLTAIGKVPWHYIINLVPLKPKKRKKCRIHSITRIIIQ